MDECAALSYEMENGDDRSSVPTTSFRRRDSGRLPEMVPPSLVSRPPAASTARATTRPATAATAVSAPNAAA